jgi:hypothetical protein
VIHAHALGYEGETPDCGAEQEEQVGFQVPGLHLLIPEPVLAAAVRTLPGNAVAGHAPHIFMHAFLADHKSAAAAPAEGNFFSTAMAGLRTFLPSARPAKRPGCSVVHGYIGKPAEALLF